MRRNAIRRQRFGAARAREVPLPLPTRGLFRDASTAEISGEYAARLENLRSNGVSMETLPPVTYGDADETAIGRFPFEFGGEIQYVTAREGELLAGGASLARTVAANADFGFLSNNIVIADGGGQPVRFNGSDLTEGAWTTDGSIAPEMFDGFLAHHDRPYFWRYRGGLDFYYGDIGAVQGALERFPLGRLGNITGEIAAIMSMTQDASENLNDSLVVVTTTGWVVIYEGTNPGDAENWRQAGRVKLAPPISRDTFAQVAGDLWMVTRAGVVSILDSLRRGQLALSSGLARPIQKKVKAMIAAGGEFQLHLAADGQQVIFNRFDGGTYAEQVIYHPGSQSWSTANYPARRWHNLGLNTQFTSPAGLLGTLDPDAAQTATGLFSITITGLDDGEAIIGSHGSIGYTVTDADVSPITAVWHSGWLRLRRGSSLAWLQPTVIAKGPLTMTVTVLTDHDETEADIEEATQSVTIEPDDPADPNGTVALNEIIAIGVAGEVYQLRLTFTAIKAELVALTAGVG